MKQIHKGNPPQPLEEHKAQSHASYDNYPEKHELRQKLWEEQGYICCYCMKRIPERALNPGCKIEHFLCQSKHREEELNYKNMLVSCTGKEGYPKHLQTCDTKKGSQDLSYSPCDQSKNIEDLIKYTSDGDIYSDDTQLNKDLDKVLNLNVNELKENRREIYKAVQDRIIKEGKNVGNKRISKRFLEKEKQFLLNKKDGKLKEYCMVGVYVINKKLAKIS